MADGKIALEELDAALHNAVTARNIRLGDRSAFYNPPDQPTTIELNMEAFNRSAKAITAALMRNAKHRIWQLHVFPGRSGH